MFPQGFHVFIEHGEHHADEEALSAFIHMLQFEDNIALDQFYPRDITGAVEQFAEAEAVEVAHAIAEQPTDVEPGIDGVFMFKHFLDGFNEFVGEGPEGIIDGCRVFLIDLDAFVFIDPDEGAFELSGSPDGEFLGEFEDGAKIFDMFFEGDASGGDEGVDAEWGDVGFGGEVPEFGGGVGVAEGHVFEVAVVIFVALKDPAGDPVFARLPNEDEDTIGFPLFSPAEYESVFG